MSSYRRVPNVNASLMHEIRMIAQQFFLSRQSEAFWNSRSKKKSEPTLLCSTCLILQNGKEQPAVTIFNGKSVCRTHLT